MGSRHHAFKPIAAEMVRGHGEMCGTSHHDREAITHTGTCTSPTTEAASQVLVGWATAYHAGRLWDAQSASWRERQGQRRGKSCHRHGEVERQPRSILDAGQTEMVGRW